MRIGYLSRLANRHHVGACESKAFETEVEHLDIEEGEGLFIGGAYGKFRLAGSDGFLEKFLSHVIPVGHIYHVCEIFVLQGAAVNVSGRSIPADGYLAGNRGLEHTHGRNVFGSHGANINTLAGHPAYVAVGIPCGECIGIGTERRNVVVRESKRGCGLYTVELSHRCILVLASHDNLAQRAGCGAGDVGGGGVEPARECEMSVGVGRKLYICGFSGRSSGHRGADAYVLHLNHEH